jgi:hypothetical protein
MQEIAMHGFGADLHFSALKEALENHDQRQTRIVWFHLTAFLAHAARKNRVRSLILHFSFFV